MFLLLPISFVFADAPADDETDEEVEEVVVTGVKQSLIDAIELKRNKVGVSEAITAEDIGKFPDSNLAESLARVAGIAVDRSNVEGKTVTVRGLGPEFNLVTLNGRQMPTTPGTWVGGRSFDFGDISSHGVSAVEVYKSANAVLPTGGLGSTINMITTKPLEAGNVASVSVTAMHDTKNEIGDDITPEVDYIFSTVGEGWGFSLSGAYHERSNREHGTNEITWIPSSEYTNVGTYFDGGTQTSNITSTNARADGVYFVPTSLYYKYKDNSRIRENRQATFQLELSENAVLTIDHTLSTVEFETEGVQSGLYFGGWNTINATVNSNGVMTNIEAHGQRSCPAWGCVDDGDSFLNGITYGHNMKENESLGANLSIDFSDTFNLSIDYHDSSSSHVGDGIDGIDNEITYSNGAWEGWDPLYEMAGKVLIKTFDVGTGEVPLVGGTLAEIWQGTVTENTLNASSMAPREGYFHDMDKSNDMYQFQVIGTWDNINGLLLDELKSVTFGYSSVTQEFRRIKATQNLKSGWSADGNPVMMNFPLVPDDIFTKVSTDGLLNGESNDWFMFVISPEDAIYWFERGDYADDGDPNTWWDGVSPFATWPRDCKADDAAEFNEAGELVNTGLSSGIGGALTTQRGVVCAGDTDSDDTVKESIESIFVNLNFADIAVGDMSARLDLGLRYEEVDQESTGITALPTNTLWGLNAFTAQGNSFNTFGMLTSDPQYFSDTGADDYFLPSVVMALDVSDDLVVRLGVAKTIARPDVNEMRTTMDIGAYSALAPTTLVKGNPNLKPYESVNVDLAVEYYYAEGSYAAINVFTKEIEGYHGTDGVLGAFNGVDDISTTDFYQDLLQASINYVNYDGSITGGGNVMCATFSWSCGLSADEKDQNFAWILAHDDGGEWWNYDWSYEGTNPTVDQAGNTVFISDGTGDPYIFNQIMPVNKYDGTLEGVEVALQHFFEGTPYGFQVNYTHIAGDTDVDPASVVEQFALPGFGDSANMSVFYEDDNLSARLSYNWRGETYAGMDEFNPLFIEERGQLDFNASYNFSDNASVFVVAQNITDEEVRLFARYEEALFLFQDHGPIYKAGIRYKF